MAHLFSWENFFFLIWLDWQKVNFTDTPGTYLSCTEVCFIKQILGIFDPEFHVSIAGIWRLSHLKSLESVFLQDLLCWLFFLCPTIICSRPASWDSHFINRNRCLEKLHSFVAKRKDPQPDSFVNPSLYFCAYIALCLLLSALPNVLQFLFQYNYRNVPLISQGSYRHDMSWNNYKTENST